MITAGNGGQATRWATPPVSLTTAPIHPTECSSSNTRSRALYCSSNRRRCPARFHACLPKQPSFESAQRWKRAWVKRRRNVVTRRRRRSGIRGWNIDGKVYDQDVIVRLTEGASSCLGVGPAHGDRDGMNVRSAWHNDGRAGMLAYVRSCMPRKITAGMAIASRPPTVPARTSAN